MIDFALDHADRAHAAIAALAVVQRIQAGIERDWLDFGRTTVYGEFGHYTAGAALGGFGPFAIQGGLGQFEAKYLMTLALSNAGRMGKYGA